MEMEPRKDEKVYRLKPDTSGRLMLPAKSQLRRSLSEGDVIVAIEEPDGSLHLKTQTQMLREVQDYFAQFVKPGECWSDELIRERREEAERE